MFYIYNMIIALYIINFILAIILIHLENKKIIHANFLN